MCAHVLYVSIHKRYNDGAVLARRLCPAQNFLSLLLSSQVGPPAPAFHLHPHLPANQPVLCSTSARVADSGGIKASRARRLGHEHTNPT